jgi:Rrf2 family protein
MRLPMAGEYAVRCVLFLCAREPGEVISRRSVAEAMGIPDQFLAKIAQQLSKAEIIEILQGAKGGYRLVRSPERVSLLEVVEAVTGEIFLNDCIVKPGCCSRSPQCSVHQVWARARTQLRQTLREATFSGLLGQESCLSTGTSVPSARREGSRISRSR